MVILTQSQIRKIGLDHELIGYQLEAFIIYVNTRNFINDDYYILVWASRFKRGIEYECSDLVGQDLLKEINEELKG